jgi:hypothetical protein
MHDVYGGMSADEIVTRVRRARGRWALSNPNFEKLLRVVVGYGQNSSLHGMSDPAPTVRPA